MKALLLAAGIGSRLRPITNTIPKCLVEINGKPLLEYWLELLINNGINEILINTHYKSEKVVDFINNNKYKEYITIVYEEELLGTGGTLLKNKSFFSKDQILLVHADNLSLFSLKEYIYSHQNRPKDTSITMMLFETDDPISCGIVELDKQGVVIGFYEKVENPPGNLANGAVYILENSIISFLESLNKITIDFSTEVIPSFLKKLYSYKNSIYHRDIGNIESLEKAKSEFPAIYKKFYDRIS
ncbi:MAG: nucleotidyltransferase family protein [Flavobacteriales bacterium]|nr:nucleotidyltransferase family protein [Leptospiraceae bacterium]MCB9336315.1 nucleotidyltransferase family protein [Flavobacteriales bacterium]